MQRSLGNHSRSVELQMPWMAQRMANFSTLIRRKRVILFLDIPVEEPTVATSDPVQLDTDEETDPEPAVDTDSEDEYETGDPCSPAR